MYIKSSFADVEYAFIDVECAFTDVECAFRVGERRFKPLSIINYMGCYDTFTVPGMEKCNLLVFSKLQCKYTSFWGIHRFQNGKITQKSIFMGKNFVVWKKTPKFAV